MKVMTMEITITDRVVEAKEKITTEAGTFDCYRISQTVIAKMPIVMRSKGTQWLDPGLGMIKSLNYSADGKKTSTTELVQVNK